jgi:hypothetical protein
MSIHEHDHGRPNPAAPFQRSPAGRAVLSRARCLLSRDRLRGSRQGGHGVLASCGWQRVRSLSGPRGCQPRGHGPGASIRGAWPRGAAPSTAIARGESFAPTRSARTPHVASSPRSPVGVSGAVGATFVTRRNELPSARRSRAAASVETAAAARRTGPPPAPPREGRNVPLHPRCLPSPNSPLAGLNHPPQAVPNLWTGRASASSTPAAPCAFDEGSGPQGLGLARARPT